MRREDDVVSNFGSFQYSWLSLGSRGLQCSQCKVATCEALRCAALIDESLVELLLVVLLEDLFAHWVQCTVSDELADLFGHPWSAVPPLAAMTNVVEGQADGSCRDIGIVCSCGHTNLSIRSRNMDPDEATGESHQSCAATDVEVDFGGGQTNNDSGDIGNKKCIYYLL